MMRILAATAVAVLMSGCALSAAESQASGTPGSDNVASAPSTGQPVTTVASVLTRDAKRARMHAAAQGLTSEAVPPITPDPTQDTSTDVHDGGSIDLTDNTTGQSISLSTSYLGRNSNLWATPSVTLDADGVVSTTHGDVVERVQPMRFANEQTWSFASKPAGTSDLVVRIEVSGATAVTSSAAGLEITTSASTFLYTNGSWIDAQGTSTPIAANWTGNAIELRVPAAVVESSVFPAVLDPVTGTLGTVTKGYGAAIASNGSGFLVVWEDYSSTHPLTPHVLAQRYSSTGVAVGSNIDVSPQPTTVEQAEPCVGYDGTNYVVGWRDSRDGRARIRVAKVVAATGVATDLGAFTAIGTTIPQYSPAMACKTGECVIAFHQPTVLGGLPDIYIGAVQTIGTLIAPLRVTAFSAGAYAATVATNGSEYLVAWETGSVGGAWIGSAIVTSVGGILLVTAANSTLKSPPTNGDSYAPALTYSASQALAPGTYLMGYTTYSAANDADALIAPVTYPLSLVTPPTLGTEQTLAAGAGEQSNVAIECIVSTACFAMWYAGNDLFGRTVNVTTGVGGTTSTVTNASGAQQNAAITFSATQFFAVWDDARGSDWQSYGARITSSGVPGTSFLVSNP